MLSGEGKYNFIVVAPPLFSNLYFWYTPLTMKRTRQPKPVTRRKRHGFLARAIKEKTPGSGSHVLQKRRAKGRKRLSVR